MNKRGILIGAFMLAAFAAYQARVFAVQTVHDRAAIERDMAIEALVKDSRPLLVPTAGMKMSDYESGCLSALTRSGSVSAQRRLKIEELQSSLK